MGSCNGLVLVVTEENSKFLFNPSTRMRKELPKSPFGLYSLNGDNQYGFGLGLAHAKFWRYIASLSWVFFLVYSWKVKYD